MKILNLKSREIYQAKKDNRRFIKSRLKMAWKRLFKLRNIILIWLKLFKHLSRKERFCRLR